MRESIGRSPIKTNTNRSMRIFCILVTGQYEGYGTQKADKSNDAYKAALDGGGLGEASRAVVQAMDQVYYSPTPERRTRTRPVSMSLQLTDSQLYRLGKQR